MQIIVKGTTGSGVAPIEAGSYRAICYGLVVLGTTYSAAFDKAQTSVLFLFELPDERITVNGEDLPRAISVTYNLPKVMTEKSNLWKFLVSWRGKEFTPEELEGFDLVNVLGAPCLVSTTIGVSKQGREFAKVSGVARLPKGMIVPKETENEKVLFDITNPDCPIEEMEKLPEWIQNRIKESVEYKQRTDTSDFEIIADDQDLPFDV